MIDRQASIDIEMTQSDESTAQPSAATIDTQTRLQLAYAAFGRLKDYGTGVLKEVTPPRGRMRRG